MAIFEGDEEYINSTNSSYLTIKIMKPNIDKTNKTNETNKTQRKQVISETAMKKTEILIIPIKILVLFSRLCLIIRRR